VDRSEGLAKITRSMRPKRSQSDSQTATSAPGADVTGGSPGRLSASRERFGYLGACPPRAIAHRGGSLEWTENTMAAFQGAWDLGFTYFELDVRATADGVLVVFHDDSMERLAGRPEAVEECTIEQLAEVRLGAANAAIPTLEEVLTTFPDVRIHLDVKDASSIDPLCNLLTRLDDPGRFCVACFAPRPLARIRAQLGEGYLTNLSIPEMGRLRSASFGLPSGPIKGFVASVPPKNGRLRVVDRRFVDAAHERGIEVHVWTIDDSSQMEELLDFGVDAIMTDRPTVLKELLVKRGAWNPPPAGGATADADALTRRDDE